MSDYPAIAATERRTFYTLDEQQVLTVNPGVPVSDVLELASTLLGEPRELRLRCQPGERGTLVGIIQILDDEGETHASLGFRADGHLLLEPGRLLDDPPGLLLKLMLGSLWQDQAKGENERPPH